MNCISSISCRLPCCQNEEERKFSPAFRLTAIALGVIALIVGSLILFKIPSLHQIGTTTGWAFLSFGGALFASGVFMRCLKNSKEDSSKDLSKETIEGEYNDLIESLQREKIQIPPFYFLEARSPLE